MKMFVFSVLFSLLTSVGFAQVVVDVPGVHINVAPRVYRVPTFVTPYPYVVRPRVVVPRVIEVPVTIPVRVSKFYYRNRAVRVVVH